MSTRPAAPTSVSGPRSIYGLDRGDVDGRGALRALLGVIRDARALGEGAESVTGDAGEMDEEVLAGLVGRDEPEALVVAEPLHGTGRHVLYLHGGRVLRTPMMPWHSNCGRALLFRAICPVRTCDKVAPRRTQYCSAPWRSRRQRTTSSPSPTRGWTAS